MQTVFVIDDSEDDRLILATLLRFDGYEVITYSGGEEALAGLPTTPPAAIFLDMRLPIMSGIEVAKRIRSRASYAEVPLIAMSAFLDLYPKAAIEAAGFSTWARKPLDPSQIRALLQGIVAGAGDVAAGPPPE